MNLALIFMRIFFFLICIFFMTVYMLSLPGEAKATSALIGVGLGALFGLLLMGFDLLFRRFNLRSFNIAIIGLFIGYLMGQALVLIFGAILKISQASILLAPQVTEILTIALFLFGIYLGTMMTLRASDELQISIPFIRFKPSAQKKKDIIIEASALADSRLIDLAASGLLNHHLVIPRFIVKELYASIEVGSEKEKTKARKCLENIKKLEEMPELGVRFNETDFPEIKDYLQKLVRLARLLDANIISTDVTKVQIAVIDGVLLINIEDLAKSLQPLHEAGEIIHIKIQRYGKEPRQGVGYLEDGTMVVVNGGGDFIGEAIEAQVLSVKHTGTGRMIFCNAMEDDYEEQPPNNY